MVSDIQIQTATGLVSWDEYRGDGWEDSGIGHIRPSFPIIKIVQGTSTMPAASRHGGDFWHSDWEIYTPELEGVALVMRETRAMFLQNASEPSCRSNDGVAPAPEQPQWVGTNAPKACADCPFSQWGPNGEAPTCKTSLVLLIDRGKGDLAQLRVAGKSMRVLRSFISRKCAPKRLPLYAYRLVMNTVTHAEEGKKWHELNIAGTLMAPTESRAYSDLLRAYRAEFERTLHEEGEVEWPDDVPEVVNKATGEIVPRGSVMERLGIDHRPAQRTRPPMGEPDVIDSDDLPFE